MSDIDRMAARTGRVLLDDGSWVNEMGTFGHIFHNTTTTPGNGIPLDVRSYTTLIVEIWGTSTTRAISFKKSIVSGTIYPLQGYKDGDSSYTPVNGTTEKDVVFTFDVSGVETVEIHLDSVAGGNISIAGNLV